MGAREPKEKIHPWTNELPKKCRLWGISLSLWKSCQISFSFSSFLTSGIN
jgi:hypothetical protein